MSEIKTDKRKLCGALRVMFAPLEDIADCEFDGKKKPTFKKAAKDYAIGARLTVEEMEDALKWAVKEVFGIKIL